MSPVHSTGIRKDTESLDYDIDASSIFEQDFQQQTEHERSRVERQRWFVCMAIGCCTGAVAFAIDVITMQLLKAKYHLAASAWHYPAGDASSDPHGGAFFSCLCAYTAVSMLFVAIAAALVALIEPVAGGSGIPEVKTYLQGVKVPRLLRTATLLCKTIGVLFSVSGGLVVGKEGPMIHAGAIVAAGLSQGSSKTCSWRTMWLKRFRNDHDKRDFVSAGAAAGVAAAFGAPIGGVLFAMEEAATFWSQGLTWRTFFCALCSTFTLNFLLSTSEAFQAEKGVNSAPFGQLSHPGLLAFGEFPQGDPYSVAELPIFMLIGVAGGLLGALFNRTNVKLTVWRKKHMASKGRRFFEAVGMGFLTAVLACTLPFVMRAFVDCTHVEDVVPIPNISGVGVAGAAAHAHAGPGRHHPWDYDDGNRTLGRNENELQRAFHEMVCRDEHKRSEAVTLLLASHDEAIKTLFHSEGQGDFEAPMLAFGLFFCFSFGMGLVTYGIAVPSGLFVPAIMSGAAMGRLVGEVVQSSAPSLITAGSSAPGNYALIGAAAMLGGISRMTISITVIVIESTTNVSFLLPIALTIFVAKFVGDLFSDGIYDLHIRLKAFPFLPENPPRARERMQARHVMAKGVKTVCELEQVGTLVKLLRGTTHHGFPVVARGGGGGAGEQRVLGVILRDQLCTVLKQRQFELRRTPSPSPHLNMRERSGPAGSSPPLTADAFLRPWFKDLEVDDLGLRPDDLDLYVNLKPYVNEAALVTLQNTSLRRVSRLFRSMGLRHLLVVESCPKVVGMITRKDIIMGGDDEAPPDVATTRPQRSSPKWSRRFSRVLQRVRPNAAPPRRGSLPRATRESGLAPLCGSEHAPAAAPAAASTPTVSPSSRNRTASAPATAINSGATEGGGGHASAPGARANPLAERLCGSSNASAGGPTLSVARPCDIDSQPEGEVVPVRLSPR